MSTQRSIISATLLGLALVTSVAATPASAHSWWGFHRDGGRYDRDGGRHDRNGWYDSYGHYHSYGRSDSHSY